jgi:hypothetical protein
MLKYKLKIFCRMGRAPQAVGGAQASDGAPFSFFSQFWTGRTKDIRLDIAKISFIVTPLIKLFTDLITGWLISTIKNIATPDKYLERGRILTAGYELSLITNFKDELIS